MTERTDEESQRERISRDPYLRSMRVFLDIAKEYMDNGTEYEDEDAATCIGYAYSRARAVLGISEIGKSEPGVEALVRQYADEIGLTQERMRQVRDQETLRAIINPRGIGRLLAGD